MEDIRRGAKTLQLACVLALAALLLPKAGRALPSEQGEGGLRAGLWLRRPFRLGDPHRSVAELLLDVGGACAIRQGVQPTWWDLLLASSRSKLTQRGRGRLGIDTAKTDL